MHYEYAIDAESESHNDISISNPFTMSKMNARITQDVRPRSIPASSEPARVRERQPRPLPTIQTPPARLPVALDTPLGNAQSSTKNITTKAMNIPQSSGAPIAKMADYSSPWFPVYTTEAITSSPLAKKNQPKTSHPPHRDSFEPVEISQSSQCPPTSPNTRSIQRLMQHSSATASVRKPRRSHGPLDNWVSSKRTKTSTTDSPSLTEEEGEEAEEDDDDYTPPPSVFFGLPDLHMSSDQGDGGRGLFQSAERENAIIRRERRARGEHIEDEIEFTDEEEQAPSINLIVNKSKSTSNPHKNRQLAAKAALRPAKDFFKPVRVPSGDAMNSMTKPKGEKRLETEEMLDQPIFDPNLLPNAIMNVMVVLPVDVNLLGYRACLVDDLYYSYDDLPGILESVEGVKEIKSVFVDFIVKRLEGMSLDETDVRDEELVMVRDQIRQGEGFEIELKDLTR